MALFCLHESCLLHLPGKRPVENKEGVWWRLAVGACDPVPKLECQLRDFSSTTMWVKRCVAKSAPRHLWALVASICSRSARPKNAWPRRFPCFFTGRSTYAHSTG
ncbi:hypothetical protein HBI08_237200 [Parastagonospora nodorum]|nr:hypothetical protein HBI08_237200 [Parastagonospora nodorum]